MIDNFESWPTYREHSPEDELEFQARLQSFEEEKAKGFDVSPEDRMSKMARALMERAKDPTPIGLPKMDAAIAGGMLRTLEYIRSRKEANPDDYPSEEGLN